LAAGKRKIAIFYGAGHLPDFRERLENEFGYRPVKTTWVDAWSLVRKSEDPAEKKRGNG
jgi:hypothetical protein